MNLAEFEADAYVWCSIPVDAFTKGGSDTCAANSRVRSGIEGLKPKILVWPPYCIESTVEIVICSRVIATGVRHHPEGDEWIDGNVEKGGCRAVVLQVSQ